MILLDRYEYNPETDRLGKGGFASVYKAQDLQTGQIVALKFVQKSKIPERYTLFEETERVKSLEHPNLVKYYDFFIKAFENVTGEKDEIQIGVMEYINGGDLGAYMRVHTSQNPRRIAELLHGILLGLRHLHQNRIVHRDVKPQNILLEIQDGEITPKVADFSISKELRQELTSVSAAVGTYEYMSPEQLGKTDAKLGFRTDIWSFGVLTYQLLTGNLPFGSRRQGDTDGKIIANIINPEYSPDLKDVPDAFHPLISRCLQKLAEDRFADIDEMLAVLPPPHLLDNSETASTNLPDPVLAPEEEEKGFFTEIAEGESSWRTRTSLPENVPEEDTQIPEEPKSPEAKTPLPEEDSRATKSSEKRKKSRAWMLVPLVMVLALATWIQYVGDWWNLFERSNRKEISRSHSTSEHPVLNEDSILQAKPVTTQENYPMAPPRSTPGLEHKTEDSDNNYSFPEDTGFQLPQVEVRYESQNPNPTSGPQPPANNTPSKSPSHPQTPKNPSTPQKPELPKQTRTTSTLSNAGQGNTLKYEYQEEYSSGKIVGLQGKFGIVDRNEKVIIPIMYERISFFSDGLAAAQKGGKWGYINRKNQVIINFKYDRPGNFVSGKARVYRNGLAYIIDKKGKEKRVE